MYNNKICNQQNISFNSSLFVDLYVDFDISTPITHIRWRPFWKYAN